MRTTHAVTDPNDWPRHLVSFRIDQMQQVSRMVVPAGIVAEACLVQDIALTRLDAVRNPNAPDPPTMSGRLLPEIVPEWFVKFFGKAVRVGGEDRDISRAGTWIVQWNVLLYAQVQHLFLRVCCCIGILADVLSGDFVLNRPEGSHICSGPGSQQ